MKDTGLNILVLVALALDSVQNFMYQHIHSNIKGCVQKPSDFESIWTFSEQIYSLYVELWNSYIIRFGGSDSSAYEVCSLQRCDALWSVK
jgi:hypothetical protein